VPTKMCRHCGRKRGHAPGCTRRRASPLPRQKTPRSSLAQAREWLRLFGANRGCISETGARFFVQLLDRVAALEAEVSGLRDAALRQQKKE
jgi:hypothetical protein